MIKEKSDFAKRVAKSMFEYMNVNSGGLENDIGEPTHTINGEKRKLYKRFRNGEKNIKYEKGGLFDGWQYKKNIQNWTTIADFIYDGIPCYYTGGVFWKTLFGIDLDCHNGEKDLKKAVKIILDFFGKNNCIVYPSPRGCHIYIKINYLGKKAHDYNDLCKEYAKILELYFVELGIETFPEIKGNISDNYWGNDEYHYAFLFTMPLKKDYTEKDLNEFDNAPEKSYNWLLDGLSFLKENLNAKRNENTRTNRKDGNNQNNLVDQPRCIDGIGHGRRQRGDRIPCGGMDGKRPDGFYRRNYKIDRNKYLHKELPKYFRCKENHHSSESIKGKIKSTQTQVDLSESEINSEFLYNSGQQDSKRTKQKVNKGSISYLPFNDEQIAELFKRTNKIYQPFAKNAYNKLGNKEYKKNRYIKEIDFTICLQVINLCSIMPNKYNLQMPHHRIVVVWRNLYRKGLVPRSIDTSQLTVLRNILADCAYLKIFDNTYWFKAGEHSGKAMEWCIADFLLYKIDEVSPTIDDIFVEFVCRRWRPKLIYQEISSFYYDEREINEKLYEFDPMLC